MRKFAFLAAVPALMLVMSLPALAEGGWSSSQMSSRNGDRSEGQSGGGGNYLSREVAPGIYERTRIPDRFTSSGNYRSGSYHSGGVGDQTGHSGFHNGGK